jgi:hypothetical protein
VTVVTVLVVPPWVAPCGLGILSLSVSWGGNILAPFVGIKSIFLENLKTMLHDIFVRVLF